MQKNRVHSIGQLAGWILVLEGQSKKKHEAELKLIKYTDRVVEYLEYGGGRGRRGARGDGGL